MSAHMALDVSDMPSSPRRDYLLPTDARIIAALIAICCLTLLLISAHLQPNPSGVGTHTALGLARCQFLATWGIPCPSCGMTTSFSWFVRGNLLASLYVQPMGTTIALLDALGFWLAGYSAASGRPVYRLLQRIPSKYYLIVLPAWAIAAWGWKIFIHTRGLDGWPIR
ncbi:MAG: DUF2752 domain-containing protein [Phycisphaerae bacterium]|nr:DUF2752 domain-containing protein [Phycisphaerae bacterium]